MRLFALSVVALCLWPASGRSAPTLANDADARFRSIIERAETRKFSCAVKGGAFNQEGHDAVRLELHCADGHSLGFVLGLPALNRERPIPKWFALAADEGVSAEDARLMEGVIDEIIVADPWSEHAAINERPDALAGDFLVAGESDIGRTQEVAIIAVLFLSFIAGAGYLLASRLE